MPGNLPLQPPQGGEALKSRKAVWKPILILIGLVAALVAGLTPAVIHQRKMADETSAVSSLRGIGFGLFEFESEYGKLPDRTTAMEVKRRTGTKLTLSDKTSNDVFVQLIAAGLSEEFCFDTHSEPSVKPDNICESDSTALAHGETGFAYISGLSSKKGYPSRPIVFGPVIPGTTRLDPKAFDGKAVVLKMDNSVTSLKISPDGKLVDSNGEDLLDPKHPVWGGEDFVVKWPK
jgi:hypothetical protein